MSVAPPSYAPLPYARLLLLPTVCGLLACAAAGPDYRAPHAAVPAQWHYAASAPALAPAPAEWWRSYGDAGLDELIAAAFQHSPDLRSAQSRLREARAGLRVSEGARLPRLDAAATARRAESAGAGEASDTYGAGLDASWEADLFGGLRRGVEAAQAGVEASAAELADARIVLAAETARLYVDLRTQQARLRMARESLASQSETLQIVSWRQSAGLVNELDRLQAESARETTRARIPLLEAGIAADLAGLAVLSGLSADSVRTRFGAPAPLPFLPAEAGLPMPAEVLRQRPDVRAAERRLAAATAQVGVAEAARYPALRLSGSVGFGAGAADLLLRPDALTSTLLAGLSAPLFDGARLRQTLEIRNAQQEQALLAWEKSVAQAQAEVETALATLARQKQRLASLERAAAAARAAAALARDRYAAGLIDYTTLHDALRSELAATDARETAAGDGLLASIRLHRALGAALPATPLASSATP